MYVLIWTKIFKPSDTEVPEMAIHCIFSTASFSVMIIIIMMNYSNFINKDRLQQESQRQWQKSMGTLLAKESSQVLDDDDGCGGDNDEF